jgi:hypothetical protein
VFITGPPPLIVRFSLPNSYTRFALGSLCSMEPSEKDQRQIKYRFTKPSNIKLGDQIRYSIKTLHTHIRFGISQTLKHTNLIFYVDGVPHTVKNNVLESVQSNTISTATSILTSQHYSQFGIETLSSICPPIQLPPFV